MTMAEVADKIMLSCCMGTFDIGDIVTGKVIYTFFTSCRCSGYNMCTDLLIIGKTMKITRTDIIRMPLLAQGSFSKVYGNGKVLYRVGKCLGNVLNFITNIYIYTYLNHPNIMHAL